MIYLIMFNVILSYLLKTRPSFKVSKRTANNLNKDIKEINGLSKGK